MHTYAVCCDPFDIRYLEKFKQPHVVNGDYLHINDIITVPEFHCAVVRTKNESCIEIMRISQFYKTWAAVYLVGGHVLGDAEPGFKMFGSRILYGNRDSFRLGQTIINDKRANECLNTLLFEPPEMEIFDQETYVQMVFTLDQKIRGITVPK